MSLCSDVNDVEDDKCDADDSAMASPRDTSVLDQGQYFSSLNLSATSVNLGVYSVPYTQCTAYTECAEF